MILVLGIGVPPSSHFIYIPIIFTLGIVIGFVLGAKATRDALALEARKAAEREERKARRAAAAAGGAATIVSGGGAETPK
jgi:homoserine kinase